MKSPYVWARHRGNNSTDLSYLNQTSQLEKQERHKQARSLPALFALRRYIPFQNQKGHVSQNRNQNTLG